LISDQGELALCISISEPTCEAQITAYTPLDTFHIPDAHINAYLHLSHIENTKNSVSPINSTIPQFLSSIFSSSDSYVNLRPVAEGLRSVFAGKKYKPVAQKIRAVLADLPEKFHIVRKIVGDPLADMPSLPKIPPPFEPTEHYTLERKQRMDANHPAGFLWPAERELMHHLVRMQERGFTWEDSERGHFRENFFPPVDIPVIPHIPWVERNIPIPPGLYDEVCRVIKTKIDAGVYEPSNLSYHSRRFCVVKKDGKSLRLVHSLEPLNKVTIQHSGAPPFTDQLAEGFAGRACGAVLDLYVGYDERALAPSSRDLTTFQTPYGAKHLTTLPTVGWSNSVPIFHEDVVHILQPEIPHVTDPYIDDVGVKGPKTTYPTADRPARQKSYPRIQASGTSFSSTSRTSIE
jgi:hypothetical protein